MNCISLGYFCSVALELEKLGLRRQSSPFDWTISEFPGVISAIQNGFEDYLKYDLLYQSRRNCSYYQNMRYHVQFFHDFDAYHSLKAQLLRVQEKYERRIKRFYQSIKEPTLFIRYISDEQLLDGKVVELQWIEDHYEEIIQILKAFNKENQIIFIANANVNSNRIPIYHVERDLGDTVCRTPITSCPKLMDRLSSLNIENKERNIERYNQKVKAESHVINKISRKVKRLYQTMFLKEYHHSIKY